MAEDSDQIDLVERLEKSLQQRDLENAQLIQTVNSLLHRSVEYGRATRALGENPEEQKCREYVDNVIVFYQKYHSTITCLERQDPEIWTATINKIRMWANGYLKNQHIDGSLRTKSVEECVPNAVLAYLSSVYHYDTEFDAWFCVLVQNVCRKYIKDQMRNGRMLEKEALSIDEVDYLLEKLADDRELDSRRLKELRSELLEATKRLSSEARQQLIILYYFSGFSFKEIAQTMGKSMNAIYKLHFDALNELRGNLGN
jgi:RNA polymerase sigma factor (sigma-70 family)